LKEFLSDPRVVALPRWLWLPVLNLFVLNTRPAKSAEKYAQIWTPEGSPLAVHTARQAKLLAQKTGLQVEYAMRYGEPSIASVLKKMPAPFVVVPLYPQYAESATGSVLAQIGDHPSIRHFHAHPGYLGALAANVRRYWDAHGRGAMLVTSFHGLPKRGAGVYEAQCRNTARLLADELGLKEREWLITFQSRFGAARWLEPYTQPTLEKLAREGVGAVDVVCPGFVSDCLETLEEIGITARDAFLAAGGKELRLIPCLNESPEWIDALVQIARI